MQQRLGMFSVFSLRVLVCVWWCKVVQTGADQSPSTSDVSNVTLAALRLPAGRFSPIFSSFSRRHLPPFLDFALWKQSKPKRFVCENWKLRHRLLFFLADMCFSSFSGRTFSAHLPTRRRWGTRAGTVSSAPPLRSLCTWMWSWAATGGPVPSRTPRWCWRSRHRSARPCRAWESPRFWAALELKEGIRVTSSNLLCAKVPARAQRAALA